MGIFYSHLNASDRVAIMLLRRNGVGVRAIARALGRDPGTISRELGRQPEFGARGYQAGLGQADAMYRRRRSRNPRKLRPGETLFETVAGHLREGWSPLQIAGRLRRMEPADPRSRVCHETIYLALYALPRGELRRELLACLRQRRQARRPRSRGTDRRRDIAEALRIAARPAEIVERRIPGHWEGDLIKGASNRSAVGSLVERTSRLVMIARLDGLDALAVQHGFERLFDQMPAGLRKTLTYDRGSEMARHADLTRTIGVKVYFADPYSPWQRGSNENMNGLIREYLPKGTDLGRFTQDELDDIAYRLNSRPRKILDFRTPREVYNEHLNAVIAAEAPPP
jgi:IS30 family transposase